MLELSFKIYDTILLEDLALRLMQIIGKKVNINKVDRKPNYIDMIDGNFDNVLLSNDTIFEKTEMKSMKLEKPLYYKNYIHLRMIEIS